jgi:type I restriction enzyme S subunit
MRRYPEYKESGVEWIGEIPVHWKISKIKHIATLISQKSTPETDAIKISPENVESETGKVLNFYSPYNSVGVKFQAGDVLFNKLRAYLSKVVFAEYSGYSLGEMIVIRPSLQDTGKYLFYLMLSPRFIEYCDSISYGVKMPRTSVDDILSARIPLASYQEQTQIVNFLDCKTKQIDELIRIKARRVELLHEQRTVLIHETVTKGLDLNVEMKPSGVEYIGDIPKHWEILEVKHVGSSNPSKNNPKTAHLKDKPIVFLPMERVHTDGTIDQELRMPYSQLKSGYTYFEENDILIAKVTPCFENGKIVLIRNLATSVGFGSTEFIVIRPNPQKVFPPFLYYTLYNPPLRSIGKHFMTGAVGLKRVPTRFVENFKIPIPIYQEQTQIANFLDRKIAQIDELRSNEQQSIELLKEYRQTLIYEVVTGKIDVRAVSAGQRILNKDSLDE